MRATLWPPLSPPIQAAQRSEHFPAPKESDFRDGVFSGAYVLKDFEPGVRAFATRNPNYFKEDRGWFDEIETMAISDVNARTNALKTGQIDYMNRCELKTVHLLKRSKGIQVMQQDGFKHYTFAMRCDTPLTTTTISGWP
jgi:peptide/nickel transport system substrate-binding protein